jgi:hypothetical protein
LEEDFKRLEPGAFTQNKFRKNKMFEIRKKSKTFKRKERSKRASLKQVYKRTGLSHLDSKKYVRKNKYLISMKRNQRRQRVESQPLLAP